MKQKNSFYFQTKNDFTYKKSMKKKSHNKSFYKEKVVVLAFGLTGCGKSEFGNAFLQLINKFNASNDCNSVTFRTNIRKKLIGMIWIYYIDTPGFASSDGKDNEYILQC